MGAKMNLLGVVVVVLLACVENSSGNFWANKKIHCGVSPWSDWSASGGTRYRTRTVVRNPRNGGNACPSLRETASGISRPNTRGRLNVPTGDARSIFATAVGFAGGSGTGGYLTLFPRDLLIIIDMSGGISQNVWTATKRKLADLVGRLGGGIGQGRQYNRIAIMTFSSSVVLNFNFKTHWTIASVRQAILNMPQNRRLTCTGDAFEYAHRNMFEPDTGIRSSSESVKEVLVLTDGLSNCGADLSQELRRLQVKAFVFALAIGDYGTRGRTQIESMVSRPLIDHIFSLANFFEFSTMVDGVLQYPDTSVPFELT